MRLWREAVDVTLNRLQESVSSAVSQGVNIALGQQKGFDWTAVAASAVAAPIADAAGAKVGTETQSALGQEGSEVAAGLTQAAINETGYAVATGGKINYAQIVGDAFGNPIGNSIVQSLTPQYGLTQAQQQQEYADISSSASTAVADDGKQIATAAGGSSFAQDAPLTSNIDLSTFYQPSAEEIASEVPVPPTIVTAQSNDGITTLMDSSDPVAVEAFQHANGMSGTDFTIYAGQNYTMPGPADWAAAEADGGQQGQATLDASNAQLLAQLQPVDVTASPLALPSQTSAAVSYTYGYGNINIGGMPVPSVIAGLADLESSLDSAASGVKGWINDEAAGFVKWLDTSSTEQNASYLAAKGWVGGNTPNAPTYSTETNGQRLEGPAITLAALTPGLDAVAPTVELTDTGLALIASKTAVGFGLGYLGAEGTGTASTTGDVAAGLAGALVLNIGGPAASMLSKALPVLGPFGSTAAVSGFGVGGTELSAQIGDALTGNGDIDLPKVGYMTLTGTAASLTMGEPALAAGGEYAELGPIGKTVTDSIGAVTTGLGSFLAGKIWQGTTNGAPNNASAMPPGGEPFSPDAPNNNPLWNTYPE